MRLPTAVLGALEIAINRALADDARALARCAELAGRSLAVHASDLSLALIVVAVDHGVQILAWREDAVSDVSLTGRSTAFAAAARAPNGDAIAGTGLRIEGDIAVAQSFARLFAGLELDPADWVDQRFGSVVAGIFERGLNTTRRFAHRAARELPEQASEYLIEETGDAIGRDEGRCLTADVASLRDDVERLAARIGRLTARD